MTDISVTTSTYQPADRPWLLWEADGTIGSVARIDGTLNFALFTANTHYPNGYIASGTVVGKVTSGGRIGPYDNAASDGRQTAIGFLFNDVKVPPSTSTKVQVAIVDAFAAVSQSRLPANHGLDSAGIADLPLIKVRA
jgi:hypothetical protein